MNPMNAEAALKERRERIRWFLLRALDTARPGGMFIASLQDVIRSVYPDATELELMRELDYLKNRELITVVIDPTERWYAEIGRHGSDVVQYAVAVDPGIARPKFGG